MACPNFQTLPFRAEALPVVHFLGDKEKMGEG